jgi:hypothetical protein
MQKKRRILMIAAAAVFVGLLIWNAVLQLELRKYKPQIEAYLPEDIYVAVDSTIELYNDQVAFAGVRDGYSFNWDCAIGENLEASVLATIMAKELGIPYVLAKAQTELQAKVLKKVGADRIIFPEKETGIRIAHNLMGGNFINAIEISNKYSMIDFDIPQEWVGKSLRELNLRVTKKINVIGVKRKEDFEITPDADAPLLEHDILVVIGNNQALNKLTGGPEA